MSMCKAWTYCDLWTELDGMNRVNRRENKYHVLWASTTESQDWKQVKETDLGCGLVL